MTHAERSLRNVAPYSSTGSSSVTENPHTKRVRNGERKKSNLCGDPGKCPHYFALRFDAAIREYESALDLNPNFAPGHWHLGWALEQVGRYDEAISHAQQAIDISEGNLLYVASLGHAYAIAGRTEEARAILDQLDKERAIRHVSAYHFAVILGALGDIDKAFAWLDRAVDERSPWIGYMGVDPGIGTLREDSRLDMFFQRANLVL